ncbi:hypothetical protein [Duganella sacchari]|nr:hypothetical protein [Duganella sacchari]
MHGKNDGVQRLRGLRVPQRHLDSLRKAMDGHGRRLQVVVLPGPG